MIACHESALARQHKRCRRIPGAFGWYRSHSAARSLSNARPRRPNLSPAPRPRVGPAHMRGVSSTPGHPRLRSMSGHSETSMQTHGGSEPCRGEQSHITASHEGQTIRATPEPCLKGARPAPAVACVAAVAPPPPLLSLACEGYVAGAPHQKRGPAPQTGLATSPPALGELPQSHPARPEAAGCLQSVWSPPPCASWRGVPRARREQQRAQMLRAQLPHALPAMTPPAVLCPA